MLSWVTVTERKILSICCESIHSHVPLKLPHSIFKVCFFKFFVRLNENPCREIAAVHWTMSSKNFSMSGWNNCIWPDTRKKSYIAGHFDTFLFHYNVILSLKKVSKLSLNYRRIIYTVNDLFVLRHYVNIRCVFLKHFIALEPHGSNCIFKNVEVHK